MKQLNFRVTDEVGKAFYSFCEGQGVKPYELLEAIVNLYGRGQLIKEKADKKEITADEAFIELGKIMTDAKKMAKANGEFQVALNELLKPYNVKISELKPI